jgi:hypothetical protein
MPRRTGRGSPRTIGPSVAPRHTRVGRGRVLRRYLRRPLSAPRSRAAPINTRPFPSSAGITTPPHHPRRRRRAAPPPSFRGQASAPIPFLEPIEQTRAACCPGRARAVAEAGPPRPPPSVPAARPRRRDLRPNISHPQSLGEPAVVPRRFPGRERRWLAGIWPAPPPPMAKGQIASPKLCVGCFVQSRGVFVRL